MTRLRISAKNLGKIALPESVFCPRCFWIEARMSFKLPYQIFPGIFSSLDSYQKKAIHGYFEKHGHLPPWLSTLSSMGQGKPMDIPHLAEFRYYDSATDILLTGVPDELLQMPDSICILDYKTAKYTGNQDSLLPIYRAQLNGYALIAEHIGMGKVSGLALVYFEPVTDIEEIDVDALIGTAGFSMKFTARILPVELNLSMIPPLLKLARAICDIEEAPEGRSGCKDCKLLNELMGCDTVTVAEMPIGVGLSSKKFGRIDK
jgi:hypothetical protein